MWDKKIYVFSGYSGSGKDTCASLVSGSVNIKFSSPGKRALEAILGVPEGFLDDRKKREQIVPWCQGRTYLQVLIDFSLHRDKVIGKDFFPREVQQSIEDAMYTNNDVCITDMRHFSEGAIIAEFSCQGVEVVPCWVSGGEKLPSDKDSFEILMDLCRRCQIAQPIYLDNRRRNYEGLKIQIENLTKESGTEKIVML